MINPGVISLASLQKIPNIAFPYRFEIEDNIGEAVHIHYKDIRIDLTVAEFEELSKKCGQIIDDLVNVSGFSVKDFDPMLLTMISADLTRIDRLEFREVFLEEILVDTFDAEGNIVYAPIYESRVFKALCGAGRENEAYFQSNYKSPLTLDSLSNDERISFNLEQIKKYGYPHGNELIGIDHLNRIWDGQHRAVCLYYLYGNIKVKVRSIYFKDNQINQAEDAAWIQLEKQLLEEECRFREHRSLKWFAKAVFKRIFWCSWKKADEIKTENFRRLQGIEDRLSEIERELRNEKL